MNNKYQEKIVLVFFIIWSCLMGGFDMWPQVTVWHLEPLKTPTISPLFPLSPGLNTDLAARQNYFDSKIRAQLIYNLQIVLGHISGHDKKTASLNRNQPQDLYRTFRDHSEIQKYPLVN